MAELIKFSASEVAFHIKHDLRELPTGKCNNNEAIIPERSSQNYSLLDRCQTSSDANAYRKEIEKECFKYNRKNLIHAIEVVVQCPSDCPDQQKEAFFRESYNYICSKLPMGERCVFVAEVHADERHLTPNGEMISKDHLHVMYVPAVPDNKHTDFEYKLCADELTKRAQLKQFHPGLQKHLDERGIHATVYQKKSGDGNTIALSVSQLKEITEKTGVVIKGSLTTENLADILKENQELKKSLEMANKKIELLAQEKEVEKSSWKSTSSWGTNAKEKIW